MSMETKDYSKRNLPFIIREKYLLNILFKDKQYIFQIIKLTMIIIDGNCHVVIFEWLDILR